MNELFQLLAAYNKQTNDEVLGILSGLPAEQLARDVGSYYGSILGVMNHILVSDLVWLRRFTAGISSLQAFAAELPAFTLKGWKDIVWNSLEAFRPVRAATDELIGKAVAALPAEALNAVLRYQDIRGKQQEKPAWRALLHFFNHQTHHRGQVSVLLDQMSVTNDFSNLIWKF